MLSNQVRHYFKAMQMTQECYLTTIETSLSLFRCRKIISLRIHFPSGWPLSKCPEAANTDKRQRQRHIKRKLKNKKNASARITTAEPQDSIYSTCDRVLEAPWCKKCESFRRKTALSPIRLNWSSVVVSLKCNGWWIVNWLRWGNAVFVSRGGGWLGVWRVLWSRAICHQQENCLRT